MPLDETQKWLKRIEKYNVHADKPIDPKKDPIPGPNAYELALEWKGKVLKKHKNKKQQNHIFDTISKGPVVNAYYKQL